MRITLTQAELVDALDYWFKEKLTYGGDHQLTVTRAIQSGDSVAVFVEPKPKATPE